MAFYLFIIRGKNTERQRDRQRRACSCFQTLESVSGDQSGPILGWGITEKNQFWPWITISLIIRASPFPLVALTVKPGSSLRFLNWAFAEYLWQEAHDPNTCTINLQSNNSGYYNVQNVTSVIKCDTQNFNIGSSVTRGQSLHQHQGGSWRSWRITNILIWQECALIPFTPSKC